MELARIVRDVGELLSSPLALRDLWPQCASFLCELSGASSVRIITTQTDRDPGEELVPLRFGNEDLGYIALGGTVRLDGERRALFDACAYAVGTRLHLDRFIQSSERLVELAHVDALTGVANRRRFDDTLDETCARAQSQGVPLALAVVDVDFFKAYNDRYGHQAGDDCLRKIAQALTAATRRPGDLLARYGGEEFVMLFFGTELDAAVAICETACEIVAQLGIAHQGSSLGRVSISVGVVALTDGANGTQLFHDADEALYRAKAGGRNRVVAEQYVSARVAAERVTPLGTTNLQKDLPPVVGRRRELRDLSAAVAARRLVSIVGVGGCGKTRIAIEAASRAAASFEDGVWFVDLSPISNEWLIPNAIGALFDLRLDGTTAQLVDALRDRQLLLVIDNCEHLLDAAAALVRELLAHCPGIRVLATSREALGLEAEFAYVLRTFAVPPERDEDVAELRRYDCVEMFAQRVRALDERTSVASAAEIALAASICRRLDGIPLAIELAAPRAVAVGLSQLERELREHVLPATMASFVGWSYALLSEVEQRVFRRLAVFSGGFTVDAATSVCWDVEIARADVVAAIGRLARKSLIVGEPADPRAQLRMLETIREFAIAQLWQRDDVREIRKRHAQWALAYVQSLSPMRHGEQSREWITLLSGEIDNFRTALQWTIDERNDVTLGAMLTVALGGFLHDYAPAEGLRRAQRALEVLPPGTAPLAEAELYLSIGALRMLPADQTRAAAERALALFGALGDLRGEARALRVLAQTIGWYFRAERALADQLACRSIALARELGDPYELIVSLRTRGLTIDISDFASKRAVLLEALDLSRKHRFERLTGNNLTWISEMEFSAGDRTKAFEYGREALKIAESSGSRELHGNAAVNFAIYAAVLGEYETAFDVARRALHVARTTQTASAVTYAVQALAIVAAGRGDHARAARLLGFCDARDGALHPPRQADQCEDITRRELLARLQRELGDVLAAELELGARLHEDAAIAEATA